MPRLFRFAPMGPHGPQCPSGPRRRPAAGRRRRWATGGRTAAGAQYLKVPLNPPRCACTVVPACRATSVNPHSVKLHCKCKVTVKSLKGGPPSRFSNKRCSRLGKTLTFDENACFTSAPEGCRALAAVPAQIHQIRCTGTAYGDIRTKSAAQVPRLLTFASNVASNPLHRHRIW